LAWIAIASQFPDTTRTMRGIGDLLARGRLGVQPVFKAKKTALTARLSLGRKHPRRVFTVKDCMKTLRPLCTFVNQLFWMMKIASLFGEVTALWSLEERFGPF
jgi:hypothetical protein